MSSQKTEHYELNQWLATDQVLRTDFNADNAKVDGLLAERTCQFYTSSYVGAGSGTRTLTFPKKPMLIIIVGYFACMFTVYGSTRLCVLSLGDANKTISGTWDGYALSWKPSVGDSTAVDLDLPNETYTVLALLDADT